MDIIIKQIGGGGATTYLFMGYMSSNDMINSLAISYQNVLYSYIYVPIFMS